MDINDGTGLPGCKSHICNSTSGGGVRRGQYLRRFCEEGSVPQEVWGGGASTSGGGVRRGQYLRRWDEEGPVPQEVL